MFLYFLRHASAGQRLSSAKKDEKRGLDKDGIEQCGTVPTENLISAKKVKEGSCGKRIMRFAGP